MQYVIFRPENNMYYISPGQWTNLIESARHFDTRPNYIVDDLPDAVIKEYRLSSKYVIFRPDDNCYYISDDKWTKLIESAKHFDENPTDIINAIQRRSDMLVIAQIYNSKPDTDHAELKEEINHPARYNQHPSGVECITIVEHMTFCAGNVVKYLWRAGLKEESNVDPKEVRIRDMKKARWYLEREIARLENV